MQTDLCFEVHELHVPDHIRRGAAPSVDDARDMLQGLWGYTQFRDGQAEVIEAVLARRDVLAILPTGAGKSAIYQTTAALLTGTTLVISPLIALMLDQVQNLHRLGIPAAFINSSLKAREAAAALEALEAGRLKLCYVAPERFESGEFQARLARVAVPLFVVDEAHCVSEWGHDFRTAYTRLGAYRAAIGSPPVLALTATAPPEVRSDIREILRMQDPAMIVRGLDRPNLFWEVVETRDPSAKLRTLLARLRTLENGSAIIYTQYRQDTEELAGWLSRAGFRARAYHGGLASQEREEVQRAWMIGDTPVMVATSAFGMGVDKPDVRLVAHYTYPATLESYYQEAGRAGRDGAPATCLLLYSPSDRRTHELRFEDMHPPQEVVESVYAALEVAVDEDGRLDGTLTAWARRTGIDSERRVCAAVRVLASAEIATNTQRFHEGAFVRMLCPTEEIRRKLPRKPSGPRDVLAALWKARSEDALREGVKLEGKEIRKLGKDRRTVRTAFERLAECGIIEVNWDEAGCRVLKRGLHPTRLPIDWNAIMERQDRVRTQLEQVEAYATTNACRRLHLLAYFGEPTAADCSGCDRCGQADQFREAA